jgi:hypothetical protein
VSKRWSKWSIIILGISEERKKEQLKEEKGRNEGGKETSSNKPNGRKR